MFHKQSSQHKRHISELSLDNKEDQANKKSKKSIKDEKKSEDILIHWDRIYRYVENYEKLFGIQVHVSKGELGSLMQNGDEYKLVPFSHAASEGALFEMEEIEEDLVPLTPKLHQPGTGIAAKLSSENVRILRIFYDEKDIDKKLLIKLGQLAKEDNVELVKINFSELMTDNIDRIKLKYPKPRTNCFRFTSSNPVGSSISLAVDKVIHSLTP